MSQIPLDPTVVPPAPPEKVDTSSESPGEGPQFQFLYRPAGPHGRVREKLLRAQRVLGLDGNPSSLAAVSVSALERALNSFLRDGASRLVEVEAGSSSQHSSLSQRTLDNQAKAELRAKALRRVRELRAFKKLHS